MELVYEWALQRLCETIGPKDVVELLADGDAFHCNGIDRLPIESYRRMAHRLIQAMPIAGKW